jgi:4-hydroxy-2-oxoheptanedioate aldolase
VTAPSLLSQWSTGQPSIGLWHRLTTPRASQIAAASGFDWLCIDTQHGAVDFARLESMLVAIGRTGTPTIVRVPWHEPAAAMKALDSGAHGILFPTIRDHEETATVTQACRHPPRGYRSWGGLGLGAETPGLADSLVACGVMIETREAIANLDEILAVDGLDFVFVGPDDLAIAHGLPPSLEPSDGTLLAMIDEIAARCRDRSIPAGIYCSNPQWAARWASRGFTILAAGGDESVLRVGLGELAQTTRAAVSVDPGDPADPR